MITLHGKPIYTPTMLQLSRDTMIESPSFTDIDLERLAKLEDYKAYLINAFTVIAAGAGRLRREEGLRVTTIKGCKGRNLYAFIEAQDAIYVLLETPLTTILPKDRDHLKTSEHYQLVATIEEIRVKVMDIRNAKPEPIITPDDNVDTPRLDEPYKPVGVFERFLHWLTSKF